VDQFQSQHEPAAQAFEFDPQQARQFTAVTGAQFGYVAHPRAQRRPLPDALCEQQRFYPVLDAHPLLDEVFTLPMRTFGVLLLRRRHAHHAADLSVSGQPRREYAQHAFRVEPVSLGPTRAPVYQNAGRLEHVGSDAMRRQQSVQPKPVSPGLEAARHIYGPTQLGRSARP
jgi:hypothetical protein